MIRSITVTVSLPLDEVEIIEKAARREGVSRAHYCRDAIRRGIAADPGIVKSEERTA